MNPVGADILGDRAVVSPHGIQVYSTKYLLTETVAFRRVQLSLLALNEVE
jgi:hypothetical protein